MKSFLLGHPNGGPKREYKTAMVNGEIAVYYGLHRIDEPSDRIRFAAAIALQQPVEGFNTAEVVDFPGTPRA